MWLSSVIGAFLVVLVQFPNVENEPLSSPLPELSLIPRVARADYNSLKVLERAIEAVGGARRLSSMRAELQESEGWVILNGRRFDFKSSLYLEYSAGIRQKLVLKVETDETEILARVTDSECYWIIDGERIGLGAKELAEGRAALCEQRYVHFIPLLCEPKCEVAFAGEAQLGGQPTFELLITSPCLGKQVWAFEKSTGYLKRIRSWHVNEDGKRLMLDTLFSDYRDLGGIKVPFVTEAWADGVQVRETRSKRITWNATTDWNW